jgi:hypothetical protein
MPKAEAAD